MYSTPVRMELHGLRTESAWSLSILKHFMLGHMDFTQTRPSRIPSAQTCLDSDWNLVRTDSILWLGAEKMCTTRNWTLDGSQITWFQTSEELTTPPNGLTDGLYYLCNDHLLPTIYTLWPKIKVLYITRCVFFRRILIWWSQVGIFANWAAKYKIHMETEWWCLFGDQSDHIWQYREMWECYTCSGPVFWCEFNGDVHFVIGVTIYGNTGK